MYGRTALGADTNHGLPARRTTLQVLADALAACPADRSLWEAAIFLEESVPGADRADRVLALYQRCTEPPAAGAAAGSALSEADRAELSALTVDFAGLYGSAAQAFEASRRHGAHYQLSSTPSAAGDAARKRGLEEDAVASGQPAAKHARADAAAAAAASYGAAAAGYAGYAAAAPAAAAYGAAAYPQASYYPQYAGYSYPAGYTGYQ